MAMQASAFGTQLRRYRETAGLSQEELAERAGLTAKAVGALERGERRRPYPHTVQALANALGLDESSRRALISTVPRSAPPPVSHGVEFVGRQAELAALHGCLASAAEGRSTVAMLVGEAGIGKTTVAREFGRAAQALGAAVLSGRCFEGGWQPPYAPWVEAIAAYATGLDEGRLRRELGSGAASIARLVPDLKARVPDLPDPTPLSPDDERYRLYDAVGRFFARVAGAQPAVVVLDDLHCTDLDSLSLLRYIARSLARERLLIVGTYRDPEPGLTSDHPMRSTLASLRRESAYTQINLGGLGSEALAAYLANEAGRPLSDQLVQLIEAETGGNPFYAGEVMRHLVEHADAQRRDGQPGEVGGGVLRIPEGVRQVVSSRVARLSATAARLLRLAAGFEGSFDFDVLQQLSGLSEDALLGCLDEALEAGLLRVASQAPPAYEFAHGIVRHTLYGALNPDRRARLHRRIALSLEQAYAGRELDHAAEIATQYHASAPVGDFGQGVRYALAVAWQAKAAFAHERAVAFLRLARELAARSTPSEQADILRHLALAEADALRLEDARRSGELALEEMRLADADAGACADFLATLARALKDAGATPSLWEPLVDRGMALAIGEGGMTWARLELLRDTYEEVRSGPIRFGRWISRDPRAIAVARTKGDQDDYARTLEPLEWRSRAETDELRGFIQGWSHPLAVIRGLEVVGRDLVYRHGAFREARSVFEELLAAGERFGSLEARAEAVTQIGVCQVSTGDLEGARESLRRADEAVARLGPSHRLQLVIPGLAIGLAYYLEGDWTSLRDTSRAYATADTSLRAPLGMMAACYVAICASRAGDVTEARRWIEHVASASEAMPARTYVQNWVVAETAAAVWEIEASEYAERTSRLLAQLIQAGVGDPGVFGPFELSLARMAALQGDIDGALRNIEMAKAKLDALGNAPANAIADFDLAAALMRRPKRDRRQITTLLATSSAAFREHGMLGWVARAAGLEDKVAAG
jgi:transcriptional regulator with XRE-family HTH domain